MMPVDVEYATSNYLITLEGHKWWIAGLDRIARLTLQNSIPVIWSNDWNVRHAGWYSRKLKAIVLAPWLCWCSPVRLKDVWVHELAHALFPWADELYCFRWARALFGDIIDLDYLRIA